MDLLILGGTKFVGRHIMQTALDAGHTVTLFNRGQTNADLFPRVEKLVGDRDGGLDALQAREWDAVVDVNGYVPRLVRESAELLKESAGRYVFISTISVFADFSQPGLTEDSALATLEDESAEEITGETYGGLKVLCERVVQAVYGDRATILLPGLVVGPHDHTDRFTYWPWRVARGGNLLAPGDPQQPVQFIDGRDLAVFAIKLAEDDQAGIFNTTGPDYRLTLGKVLDACKAVGRSDAEFTWLPEEFLVANDVGPWMELPLWVTAEDAGLLQIDVSKAKDAGLVYRPLEDTIADTLAWARTRPPGHEWGAGLAADKEQAVLKKWREMKR